MDEPFTPSYADYDPSELLEQAQGNAQAALIGTVAFLQERGVPLAAWTAALGEHFARAWGEPEPWDADELLDAMLVNYRAFGAHVWHAEFTAERAEADISGFPDAEQCVLFGVAPAAVARYHDATAPLAAQRGLQWTWSYTDGQTHLVVTRAGEGG